MKAENTAEARLKTDGPAARAEVVALQVLASMALQDRDIIMYDFDPYDKYVVLVELSCPDERQKLPD